MARGRPQKQNKYKVPLEKAEEILDLKNEELVSRASLEYRNWMASVDQKKEDPELNRVKEQLKNINEEIKGTPEFIKAEEAFNKVKESLVDEETARLKEELKNLMGPFTEDINAFKGMFKTAMDEMNERRIHGKLTFK